MHNCSSESSESRNSQCAAAVAASAAVSKCFPSTRSVSGTECTHGSHMKLSISTGESIMHFSWSSRVRLCVCVWEDAQVVTPKLHADRERMVPLVPSADARLATSSRKRSALRVQQARHADCTFRMAARHLAPCRSCPGTTEPLSPTTTCAAVPTTIVAIAQGALEASAPARARASHGCR